MGWFKGMSSETWLEEFYPVTAAECAEGAKGDALVLVDHSLRKWRGATKTALRKHKIEKPPIKIRALEKAREYVQISQRPATPGQGEAEER